MSYLIIPLIKVKFLAARFFRFFSFFFLISTLLLISGCSGLSVKDDWSHYYSAFEQDRVLVCYGFGCKRQSEVELSGVEWRQIQQMFNNKAVNPEAERVMIAKAIALMERFVGQQTGTWRDKAGNSGMSQPGQMDCIDESTNTSAYLRLFAFKGWLKWHDVESRVMRSPFIVDVHWTAVIKDRQSKQLYAVDSWFKDNGHEPLIVKLEAWLNKSESH